MSERSNPRNAPLREFEDFYWDNGLMVLTRAYHLKRGSCCGNGCRHCPYEHAAVPPERRRD
jgi:hypothetical protein